MKKILFRFYFVLLALLVGGNIVMAQGDEESSEEGLPQTYSLNKSLNQVLPAGSQNVRPLYLVGVREELKGDVTDVTDSIQRITNGLTALLATFAVLFMVYHAVASAFSFGQVAPAQRHRQAFLNGAIGLLIVIFAYIIIKTILSLLYAGESMDTSQEEPIIEIVDNSGPSTYACQEVNKYIVIVDSNHTLITDFLLNPTNILAIGAIWDGQNEYTTLYESVKDNLKTGTPKECYQASSALREVLKEQRKIAVEIGMNVNNLDTW